MGFKCVPQTIGLVREMGSKTKNRAVGNKILDELGEERYSSSDTLDKTLSNLNQYVGFSSGSDCWDYLEDKANNYRSNYTDKNGKERSRKLPKQAIVGLAVIVNPPNAILATWDEETNEKFHKDSDDVLAEIYPQFFRQENQIMKAYHYDESPNLAGCHSHAVYQCIDDNGKFCGGQYDAQLRTKIDLEFAQKMQARGWDIDTPEMTDWERYKTDEEYKEKIDTKRKMQGLSEKEYSAHKIKERAEKMEQLAKETIELIEHKEKEQKQVEIIANNRKLLEGESFNYEGKKLLGVSGLNKKITALNEKINEQNNELEKIESVKNDLLKIQLDNEEQTVTLDWLQEEKEKEQKQYEENELEIKNRKEKLNNLKSKTAEQCKEGEHLDNEINRVNNTVENNESLLNEKRQKEQQLKRIKAQIGNENIEEEIKKLDEEIIQAQNVLAGLPALKKEEIEKKAQLEKIQLEQGSYNVLKANIKRLDNDIADTKNEIKDLHKKQREKAEKQEELNQLKRKKVSYNSVKREIEELDKKIEEERQKNEDNYWDEIEENAQLQQKQNSMFALVEDTQKMINNIGKLRVKQSKIDKCLQLAKPAVNNLKKMYNALAREHTLEVEKQRKLNEAIQQSVESLAEQAASIRGNAGKNDIQLGG